MLQHTASPSGTGGREPAVLEAVCVVECENTAACCESAKFLCDGARADELGQGARRLKQCTTVQPAAIPALNVGEKTASRCARFLQAQTALERVLQQMKRLCRRAQKRGAPSQKRGGRNSRYEASVPPAALSLRPSHRATTGVSATVGGKRMGDSALCAAYAMAAVPTRSLVSDAFRPTRCSSAATFTPGSAAGWLSTPASRTQNGSLSCAQRSASGTPA